MFRDFGLRNTFFRVNCAEMVKDKPEQPAYEFFSIERTFLTT